MEIGRAGVGRAAVGTELALVSGQGLGVADGIPLNLLNHIGVRAWKSSQTPRSECSQRKGLAAIREEIAPQLGHKWGAVELYKKIL